MNHTLVKFLENSNKAVSMLVFAKNTECCSVIPIIISNIKTNQLLFTNI